MSFDKRSDYWDDYNYKEVVEKIWGNYEDLAEEQKEAVKAINNSKSIKTVPYEIKRKWKKIKLKVIDGEFHLMTEFDDVVTNMNVIEDNNFNIFDKDLNEMRLEGDYKIVITDMPFEGSEPYNPIEFRNENEEVLGPTAFAEYIENDALEFWAEDYYVHNNLVFETFGELIGLNKGVYGLNKYSRKYYNMTVALWYVLVNGPTIRNIKIGLYLFYNLPMTLMEEATVEEWEVGHIKLSTGDEWYYREGFSLIDYYEDEDYNQYPVTGVGDVIPPFNFLVKGIKVKDYISNPGWWEPIGYLDDLELGKYSTVYIEINGRSYGDQSRSLSIIYDFLMRITPQYINFVLFLVLNSDDPEYSPPDGGYVPGDDDNYDDIEPTDPGGDDGTEDPGSGDDYDRDIDLDAGKAIDNAQSTDYFDERGLARDPLHVREAHADIADARIKFQAYPHQDNSYALRKRTYTFDGEIQFDNFGDELKVEIYEYDVKLKSLKTF